MLSLPISSTKTRLGDDMTLEALLKKQILKAFEDKGHYYIRLSPEHPYDNQVYIVDKSTKQVKEDFLTKYLPVIYEAKEINPNSINPFLKHHGVKGQVWGVRNGPPYPLGAEQKANLQNKNRNKQGSAELVALSATAAAIGIGVPVLGPRIIKRIDRKLDDLIADVKDHIEDNRAIKEARELVHLELKRIDSPTENGLYVLEKAETVEEAMEHTNPWNKTKAGKFNCTSCAIAGELRQQGYDVIASPHGVGRDGPRLYSKCIKNWKQVSHTIDVDSVGHTEKDFANYLLDKYKGQNASGALGSQWNIGSGHVFNWKIKDGKVKFYDYQLGYANDYPQWYFHYMTSTATIMRLDNAKWNYRKLKRLKVIE